MAVDFKVDKVPVHLLGFMMPALVFALSADRLVNGLCRPFWGWVSDHIGREKTMTMAFGLEAIAIYILLKFAYNPLLFVIKLQQQDRKSTRLNSSHSSISYAVFCLKKKKKKKKKNKK